MFLTQLPGALRDGKHRAVLSPRFIWVFPKMASAKFPLQGTLGLELLTSCCSLQLLLLCATGALLHAGLWTPFLTLCLCRLELLLSCLKPGVREKMQLATSFGVLTFCLFTSPVYTRSYFRSSLLFTAAPTYLSSESCYILVCVF